MNLARQLLKAVVAEDPEWPSEYLDNRIAVATAKYGHQVPGIPALPR